MAIEPLVYLLLLQLLVTATTLASRLAYLRQTVCGDAACLNLDATFSFFSFLVGGRRIIGGGGGGARLILILEGFSGQQKYSVNGHPA